MPKDIKEEPKKKMVVVEEVEVKDEEAPEVQEVPVIVETKAEDIQVALNQEPDSEFVEKTNYLWIIVPTALLVGALVGGLITYFSGISKLNVPEATTTPVPTVEPVETVTPKPEAKTEVKRDTIKVQVLNGSGTAGLAGKAKTYLEGLGYVGVVAGNAPTSDFEETVIAVKDTKKELLDVVKADLSKNYQVAKDTEVLPASSKYDFVVTLGSK
jgi:hypothetical protein